MERLSGPFLGLYVVGGLIAAISALVAVLFGAAGRTAPAALAGAVAVVTLALVHPISRRPGVYGSHDELVVQNLFRRYEIPWSRVVALGFPWRPRAPRLLGVVEESPEGSRRTVLAFGTAQGSVDAHRVVEYARDHGVEVDGTSP